MAKKLFYKIGEACKILDIQPYVLRYWETEFPLLTPDKSSSGQRAYSEKEIVVIRRIKELLYDEGYTIAGAKKRLDQELPELLAEFEEDPVPKGGRPSARMAAVMQNARTAAARENAAQPPAAAPAEDAPAAPQTATAEQAAALDTLAREKIEKLRTGIRLAHEQAKVLLARLEASTGVASSP